LHQGYSIARGEWLCFIDADTFAAPDLMSSTYQAANTSHAGLFTIVTNQELVTFWEKVILPLVFTALSVGFPPDRVNDPGKPDAIANGQFILFRRSVYEAVGGHQAVRAQIAEDKALAELVKRGGFSLLLADGRQLARTRMYTSLPEIWEGWTKNMYIGLQDRLWLLGIGVAVGLSGAVILPLWLILSLIWLAAGGKWVAALVVTEALLVWGYLIYQRSKINRAMHVPFFYAFSLPIGASIFTAMMVTSAFIVSSGKGVNWKGRTYH
jgi:cellulose synthase/poly-beta-1,6-N-acetylglucosamine synthase-like glycosyltransferase